MSYDPFAAACSIEVSNNYDTQGSLTLSSLRRMTPTELKAIFSPSTNVWNEMSAMLKTQFEMKACGIRRYGFYDWLMSSSKQGMSKLINVVRRDKGPSLIQPFIMGRQQSVVNIDSWGIGNGWPSSGQGAYVAYGQQGATGPMTSTQLALSTSARVIRVYNRYSVDLDAKWFLDQQRIYILNTKVGAAAHGQWKVLASAAATDLSYVDVLIIHEGPDDTLVDLTPTSGLVLIGINNINDYEKFCQNPANYNGLKYVPFWYQTRRRARRVDDQYKMLFKKLMEDNAWFAQFGDHPLSERNRQDELQWQKQMVRAFLFNRAISSNQTLTGWASLEAIRSGYGFSADVGTGAETYQAQGQSVTPGTVGTYVAYRANFIGVYDQLKACSRVIDLQNQPLNMVEFLNAIHEVSRARASQGKKADSIDCYTDADTAEMLELGIINYYKQLYGDILRIDISTGGNEFGFKWTSFKLRGKATGITLNIITEETFNDIASAFEYEDINVAGNTGALTARGRFLMILDIGSGGSIYPAILGSNRKTFKTGELSELAKVDSTFACQMESPTIETTLTSETMTAIVECPSNSLWIEGFSLTAPTLTGKTYPYGDLV